MTEPQIATDVRRYGLKDNDRSRAALADLFTYAYERFSPKDPDVLARIVSRLRHEVRVTS